MAYSNATPKPDCCDKCGSTEGLILAWYLHKHKTLCGDCETKAFSKEKIGGLYRLYFQTDGDLSDRIIKHYVGKLKMAARLYRQGDKAGGDAVLRLGGITID